MNLFYEISSKKKKTNASCEDVVIIEKKENNNVLITIKALKDIKLLKGIYPTNKKFSLKDKLFFNGYQTWTDSFEISKRKLEHNVYRQKHIIVKKWALDKYGDATFYKYRLNKIHGYDLFYSKGKNEAFIYNLNYKNAYLILEYSRFNNKFVLISDVNNISLKAGEELTLFNFKMFDSYLDGLNNFNSDFNITNTNKIFGYTSWYNYYQNINEEIILRDLDAIDSRFNLFQIDDGYEQFVGDWLDINKEKFPNGLKPIIDKIHSKGLKAGIWLAPFVAEENSRLFKEHPEMFKRYPDGSFVKCGCNWSGFYALDLSRADTLAYIKKCLEYYKNLGFDFFKLDFLYAAGLSLYDGLSRSMAQEKAYQYLKDILEDKLILGCGATLFNSYQKFDYLRMGPDVSLKFDDVLYMRFMHRERNSTKKTIQNTIYRSFINNHMFNNDPDVFLLRDTNLELTTKQKEALVTINSIFGNVLMTSDNIATYDSNKKETLTKSLDIFNNATNKKFEKHGKNINISYDLYDKHYELVYNTKKGEILWK